jgi:RNA polymerase sigma factor (sigma-70 family)
VFVNDGPAVQNSSEVETLVRRALKGDRPAQRTLIEDVLSPVVHARVARVLLRRRRYQAEMRSEMLDLSQQVFVHILSNKLLERWNPAAGSLGAFVGTIAENHVRSVLRSRVRSPFTEIATEIDILCNALGDSGMSQETSIDSRHRLRRLESELGDEDRELFFAFFVDEMSIEEMCVSTGKTKEAVYKQRNRLRERVRRILDDEAASSARMAGSAGVDGGSA